MVPKHRRETSNVVPFSFRESHFNLPGRRRCACFLSRRDIYFVDGLFPGSLTASRACCSTVCRPIRRHDVSLVQKSISTPAFTQNLKSAGAAPTATSFPCFLAD